MDKENNIKEIWQKDQYHFSIKWLDDVVCTYNTYELRKCCPCAMCVDEWTGKRKEVSFSKEEAIPTEIKSVGRYALAITFKDKHSSGIYTLSSLRKMHTNTK